MMSLALCIPAPGVRWVEGRLEGPAGGRLGNRLQVQL